MNTKIGERKKKGTRIGIHNRELAISKYLNKGYSYAEIYDAMKEDFGVTEETIRKDVSRLLKNWSKDLENIKDKLRTKYIYRIESMVKENLDKGNYKIALEAQKELNRITGMYDGEVKQADPVKVITIKEVKPASVTGKTENGEEGS